MSTNKKILNTDLISFEEKIANYFNKAKIRAPVHLTSGNENFLIDLFKNIHENDWIFCSWRSHYHCLLKGVSEKKLLSAIIAGKSISLCFPEYKIYASAIVTGIIPIAVGAALYIKNSKNTSVKTQRVFCFMGDMTSESGMAYECIKYSKNHKLPIQFIIEDNEKSVCTNTREVWGLKTLTFQKTNSLEDPYIKYCSYTSKYPHAGAGTRVQF